MLFLELALTGQSSFFPLSGDEETLQFCLVQLCPHSVPTLSECLCLPASFPVVTCSPPLVLHPLYSCPPPTLPLSSPCCPPVLLLSSYTFMLTVLHPFQVWVMLLASPCSRPRTSPPRTPTCPSPPASRLWPRSRATLPPLPPAAQRGICRRPSSTVLRWAPRDPRRATRFRPRLQEAPWLLHLWGTSTRATRCSCSPAPPTCPSTRWPRWVTSNRLLSVCPVNLTSHNLLSR